MPCPFVFRTGTRNNHQEAGPDPRLKSEKHTQAAHERNHAGNGDQEVRPGHAMPRGRFNCRRAEVFGRGEAEDQRERLSSREHSVTPVLSYWPLIVPTITGWIVQ